MSPRDEYAQVLQNLEHQVETRVTEVQKVHGYVDDAGEPSIKKVKEKAFDVLMNRCVVTSKSERSKKAMSKGELYFAVYNRDDAPAAGIDSIDELDTVEKRAYAVLSEGLWDLTQGSRSGWIQKRLGDDDSTLVLCRRRVHRPTEAIIAVYLTDNENMIKEDATDKLVASLMKRASVIRRDLDMVLHRHPKLRGQLAAQLSSELKKIQAELALPPLAELEEGAPDEDGADASKSASTEPITA
jgi:hypothetical protein